MAIERSTRTMFIGGASLLSLILIGAAYSLSGPLPFHINKVGAESTHDLLVSYASKDSDGDGLPDWQESLYGTDPNNAHSVNPSVSDADAVAQGLVQPKFATATTTAIDANIIPGATAGPTTLTDQFAKKLFGQYLKNRGGTQPTPTEIATFVEQGVAELKSSQVRKDAFNQGQVKVSGAGPDALLVYAADGERALSATKIDVSKTALEFFSDAVSKNDPSALRKLRGYGTGYAEIARSLMKTSVPKEMAASHLALANSLMLMSSSILDLAEINNDPLRAMLGLAQYQDDSVVLGQALKDMHTIFASEHVVPGLGTTGSAFYAMSVGVSSTK